MVSSRHQSATPMNQPVRFYKTVALSFLLVTVLLLGVILFMSTKRATVTIVSKDTPVDISKTIVVGKTASSPTTIVGTVTSTEIALSQVFQPTGTRQEPGVAIGFVTLHNDSSISQPLIATTRLLTPDGVLFRLKKGVTVPAQGTIEAEVYADSEGASSDIGPVSRFSIPGLNEEKQKVIYGSSNTPMKGGTKSIGVVSEDDVTKAEKQLVALLEEQGKQTLQKFFPEQSALFGVGSFKVDKSSVPIGDEVDSFTLSGTATIVGVFYASEDIESIATKELMKRAIDETELVEIGKETPTVTLKETDLANASATLEVFYNGKTSLNPESKQLQKMMLFGKTREELRRYLLSLDHVQSVEVKFTPVWVRTVPFVPEHVQVVVKKVE